ncbi:MAG: hypothetical protein JW936_01820 [Sedimentisphaerales bacterium]|nr:hypothetical protein [Sedimentisphaerales bacterium]
MKRGILLVVLSMMALPLAVGAVDNFGTDFYKDSWLTGWESDFDYTQGDCYFDPCGTWLGVGWHGVPPYVDAELETRYTRSGGNSNYYDAVLSSSGNGWLRMHNTLWLKVSLDGGLNWTTIDSELLDSQDIEFVTGLVHLDPDQTDFRTKTTLNDMGDHIGDDQLSSCYIRTISVDFCTLRSLAPSNPFHDVCTDPAFGLVYNSQGATQTTTALGDVYGLSSDGGYNHITYGFYAPDLVMEPGGDPNTFDPNVPASFANVQVTSYAEVYDDPCEYMAIEYSCDGENWSELARNDIVDANTVHQGVVMLPYANRYFYVRAAGPTVDGGETWLGYLLDVAIDVYPAMGLLGVDYSRTAWDASWEDDFDAVSGDCVFSPDGSALSIGWNSNPPTENAVIEKRFARQGNDDGAYYATISCSGAGTNSMSNVLNVEYSLDCLTWHTLGQVNLDSASTQTIEETIGVASYENVLLLRAWLPDLGDSTSGTAGGSCEISAFIVDFEPASPADINEDFRVDLIDFAEFAEYWLWSLGDYINPIEP